MSFKRTSNIQMIYSVQGIRTAFARQNTAMVVTPTGSERYVLFHKICIQVWSYANLLNEIHKAPLQVAHLDENSVRIRRLGIQVP